MANRKKLSREDIELFRRSVGPVRKISHNKAIHTRKARLSRLLTVNKPITGSQD